MKKLLLLGTMLTWGAAAVAQEDQCLPTALPTIQRTDVSTVERNADSNSAVIQLDIAATLPGGGTNWGEVPRLPLEETDRIADRLRPHLPTLA